MLTLAASSFLISIVRINPFYSINMTDSMRRRFHDLYNHCTVLDTIIVLNYVSRSYWHLADFSNLLTCLQHLMVAPIHRRNYSVRARSSVAE